MIDKIFKINKRLDNPFNEGSISWNCYIDACCSERNGIVVISEMIRYHGMTESYYKTGLKDLISMGILIEIKD